MKIASFCVVYIGLMLLPAAFILYGEELAWQATKNNHQIAEEEGKVLVRAIGSLVVEEDKAWQQKCYLVLDEGGRKIEIRLHNNMEMRERAWEMKGRKIEVRGHLIIDPAPNNPSLYRVYIDSVSMLQLFEDTIRE